MPAKIKLEDLDVNAIKDDFYNGMSVRDMSHKLSISEPSVKNILKELNLSRIGRISQRDIDNIISNKQHHISKIVKITGLDKATVKKVLQIHNIAPTKCITNPQHLPKKTRYEQFKEEFNVDIIAPLLSRSLNYACMQTGYSEVILRRYAAEYNILFTKAFVTISDISQDNIERIKTIKGCCNE